jgi:hypothetical protein
MLQSKKGRTHQEWTELSGGVPKMVEPSRAALIFFKVQETSGNLTAEKFEEVISD